ncbi:MAG: family 10 glycosylhydrolase, partial [Monoglobaceae bacterium]
FYPDASFNDDTTYSFYKDEYPNKADWRRANVNKLVQTLDERLHSVKPSIQFGISPRGIWANKDEMAEGSDTRGGGSYSTIYADSRAWVKNGWVDYIMPQIYWNIGYEIADYTVLCNWWSDVVSDTDVRLYIGEGAYRTTSSTLPAWKGETGTNELRTHIADGRNNPNISGYCCFTYNDFIENGSIYALMQEVNSSEKKAPSGAVQVNNDVSNEADSVPAVNDGMSNTGGQITEDKNYKNKFTDMDNYWWAMDAVNELAAKGIIKGRSETEFDPDSKITRADNTVLLLRVLGKTATFSENFADVYPDKYYYNEIGMAKALGIASGVGNNCFDPDAKIKRQDMATLAYRVLTEEGILTTIPNTTVLNKFVDADEIYFYAREAMAACINKGLMSGYGDNTIKPNDYASRVEVALFVYRISQLLK